MAKDFTDTSRINDIDLNEVYRDGGISVIAGYNTLTQELKEFGVDRNGGLQISSKGGNGVVSDITSDVWGRPKTVTDFSLFHGLFTYDIPDSQWLKYDDGTENISTTRIVSDAGHLSISSGPTATNTALLESKRHPRYQPNRGHLWSSAGFMPAPTATGIRQFGFINTIAGAYFQLEDGVLYAVIYDASTEKVKQAIDLSLCGLTVDSLAFGTLYDIQYQWRGVGDYFFYVNQKLVYKTDFLGKNTEITIANPALSAGYYCENTDGTEVEMRFGCVDISSEGGVREGLTYVSVANSTTKAVTTANYPTLIVHMKETINGLRNSRDVLALRCTGSSDQKSYMKAYITRDGTAITGASYTDARTNSAIEYDVTATAINTAKCQLLWNRRINIDESGMVDLPSTLVDFVLTRGDYLIITMERESPTQTANVVCSLELGEEI